MSSEMVWEVYLVRCSDNSLYCGITKDVKTRIALHNAGKGSKYTKSRKPVELVAISRKMTKSDALKLEYQVKQLPISKTFMNNISGEVTDEMWHEFFECVVNFAEHEVKKKRYGLALILGFIIWDRAEKETRHYAVRLLNSLPDDICHPLIKTLARKYEKIHS